MNHEQSLSQLRVQAAVNKAIDHARRQGMDISHAPFNEAAASYIGSCPLCKRAASIAALEHDAAWPPYPALTLALSWADIIANAGGVEAQ